MAVTKKLKKSDIFSKFVLTKYSHHLYTYKVYHILLLAKFLANYYFAASLPNWGTPVSYVL